MPVSIRQNIIAGLYAEAEYRLQRKIRQQHRPTFGTGRMRRTGRCILIAAVAMLNGWLPPGSVITIADAFDSFQRGDEPAVRSRRCWVDLPDGTSWEPVDATLLPTPRHYEICDPREIVRLGSPDELRAAMTAHGWQPGTGKRNLYLSLDAMINGGIPEGGLIFPDDPGYEPPPVPLLPEPGPAPRPPGRRLNGLSAEQLAAVRERRENTARH